MYRMGIVAVSPQFIYNNKDIFLQLSNGVKGSMTEWITEKEIRKAFIGIDSGVCIGWSVISKTYLPSVYVSPVYRGRGFGRRLGLKVYPEAKRVLAGLA